MKAWASVSFFVMTTTWTAVKEHGHDDGEAGEAFTGHASSCD
jgi:hypothetical protein